ncbi:Stealth CR1 domain-containing protein [Tenacibaculum tangerinum]|uniref:Stealth CR1 domain-containing protein n=1 Tax=Tenacibaculum tangerinum TaxID=3038772 RepID=A0ABY8L8A8_9FLAO|nr:Stealth CR1 domain-containing protein [Tenacibaculum tangerinum]WGH76623.1 Stealth CR1 domain-containing protein [Tenacibaculum tangerinum]
MQIDAVITWVDSSDELWRKKINQYLEKKIDWSNKKESTRYNSINEIEITILSILKFAVYIKNIYVVTDNQQPRNFLELKEKALSKEVNLELVDHTVIFRGYEDFLPTFNSCSIISMLFRIPNLSNNFVVFNDDTFLMRETKEEDFFIDNKPVIRGRWDSYYEDKFFRNLFQKVKGIFKKNDPKKTGYKLAQQKSAKLLGFKKYIRRDHTPVSIKKSGLENYFLENPSFLGNNIKYRFRDNTQFIISSLSNHIQIKNNDYVLDRDFKLSYFQSYKKVLIWLKLLIFSIDKSKLFMCFQSLETAEKEKQKYILEWIDKRLNSNFADEL